MKLWDKSLTLYTNWKVSLSRSEEELNSNSNTLNGIMKYVLLICTREKEYELNKTLEAHHQHEEHGQCNKNRATIK